MTRAIMAINRICAGRMCQGAGCDSCAIHDTSGAAQAEAYAAVEHSCRCAGSQPYRRRRSRLYKRSKQPAPSIGGRMSKSILDFTSSASETKFNPSWKLTRSLCRFSSCTLLMYRYSRFPTHPSPICPRGVRISMGGSHLDLTHCLCVNLCGSRADLNCFFSM